MSVVRASLEILPKCFVYLVVKSFPFPVINRDATMEELQVCVDLGRRTINMRIDDELVESQIDYDCSELISELQSTDSENFATESKEFSFIDADYVVQVPLEVN